MAVEFDTAPTFELSTDAVTWTDVTTDVLHDPSPKGSVGILNNGFLDRVPDGNTLTFSLNNSASNSQTTQAYYSSSTNLSPGHMVRVSFKFDNRYKRLLYFIPPDGIKVVGGIYGARRVDVSCRDWFGLVSEYKTSSLAYTTNKQISSALELILATLPAGLQPYYRVLADGEENFADVFDLNNADTTVISEINKITISELGYTYGTPNEGDGFTLVTEGRLDRLNKSSDTAIFKRSADTTDLFLLADGSSNMLLANGSDKLLLTETQTISMSSADVWEGRELEYNRGAKYANFSRVTTTPRIVDADATTVLWTMENSVKVTAGETIEGLAARYRDPDNKTNRINCIVGTDPEATTDYEAFENEDGTGTDLTANLRIKVTFETAEAKYSLENAGGTDLYTGGPDILFQFRGQGVKVYDTIDYIVEPQTPNSFVPYDGRRSLDFTMPYFSRTEDARYLVYHMLKDANQWRVTINSFPLSANRDAKNMMAFMHLEIGKRATFAETMTTYNEESFINGYRFEIQKGKYVFWFPCLYRYDEVNPF